MKLTANDSEWMKKAIEQAELACKNGEVPVGAILVRENKIIASGANTPISSHDPTAHAEIVVLRKAALMECNYRLPGTTLYVTLEPCAMCVGAIIHARVERVVFGATDPKTGALVSRYKLGSDGLLNHTLNISGGILADQCSAMLHNFFHAKRQKRDV